MPLLADREWYTQEYVTPDRELYRLVYCHLGDHDMAKSASKTILFGTATHDKKTKQWPIAVFNDARSAKSYVTFLRLAYRATDSDAVKVLDPHAFRTEAGGLVAGTKWSIAEVPYAPEPDLESDDTPLETTPGT